MTYKYTVLFSLVLFGSAIAVLTIAEDVWHVPLQLRQLRALKENKPNLSVNADSQAGKGNGLKTEPQIARGVNKGNNENTGGVCAPANEKDKQKNRDATANDVRTEHLELPGGGRLYLKPKDQKRVELDGAIIQQNVNIELIACAEGGKDHESIIAVKCNPEELHAALLLLGLRDRNSFGGGGPKKLGDPMKPLGDPMMVLVRWEENGKAREVRAEDLVLDSRTKTTLGHVGWVFTGSGFVDEIDIETGKTTGRQVYLANYVKTLVATYHDPTAILDLPLAEDSNNMYFANGNVLPARGTKATLILRAPTEAELKKIQTTQKAIDRKESEEDNKQESEKPRDKDTK
jgi:hypothetical protein